MVATELVSVVLKPGDKPEDPSTEAGKTLQAILKEIAAQDGCQRLFWGRQVENSDTAHLFIDWDTVGHHQKFIESEPYGPFSEKVGSIAGGALSLCHAHLSPFPPTEAITGHSPMVTEFIFAYFPANYSSADQAAFHETITGPFKSLVTKEADGYKGMASGWVEEEQDIPDDKGKGRAYAVLIGWTSVEHHLRFRETQVFKDNIHILRGAKDLQGLKVVHIPLVKGGE